MKSIFKTLVMVALLGVGHQTIAQNFITQWNLATAGSGTTQLTFGTATSGIVSYTWQEISPGTAIGSGTWSGATLTITGLPTSATIRLQIAPTNFQRIIISSGTDRNRLTQVEQWGTVAWTSMLNAFQGCANLQVLATDVPNLSAVASMRQMFIGCTIMNSPSNIGSWNTAAVTDMYSMFYQANAFNQNIGAWNTSAVTNMEYMFYSADAFNQNIGSWNTGAVITMSEMFAQAIAFNQNIGSWNTSAVTTMFGMFSGASSFNQSIGAWNLNPVVDLRNMFNNSGMDCNNYSSTLIGWSANTSTPNGRTLGATGRLYGTSVVTARTNLTVSKGWAISGDTPSGAVCSSIPAPTISSFTPTSGPVGATVTITGTKFSVTPANNTVKFNGTTAVVTASTATSITTTVPVGATTGKITVTVVGNTATSTLNFTVTTGTIPTITSFTPTTGPVGATVTITGTNFSITPSNNTVEFYDGIDSNVIGAVVTASTTTSITTTVPTGAFTGKIKVTTAGGAATSASNFTVTCGSVPIITSFSPTTGIVGTTVVITGTNFSTTPRDNFVDFGGFRAIVIGGSSTSITTTVPTGPVGLVPISITIACNTVTSSTDFNVTCLPAPTITSFTPGTGGFGTVVIITGTNFSTNPLENLVDFNGEPAIVTASTTTTITTSVPANAITGSINIVVGCNSISTSTPFLVTSACNLTTGGIDNTFNPVSNSNGNFSIIDDLAIQPDGKILLNDFETGGIEYNMCRLLADGTFDPAFTQWNRTLFTGMGDLIALQTDGKILLGGRFTTINGANYGRIVRFNSDGSIDGTFNVSASGFDDQVRAITIQPDGKIIVGGSFTSYNGSPANSIVRINADGTIDGGFGFGSGFNREVRSIIQQTDGKILLGGSFTTYNSTTVQSIVRLNSDGTLDLSFTPPSLLFVDEIALQSDNKIVLYGDTGLIRLNQNGTVDGTFNTGSGFDDHVATIYCEPSGKIIVGGYFQNINGTNKNFIARLNPNGSVDNFFDAGVAGNSWVFDIVPAGTNNFLVAGYFDLWNNQPQNGIARLNIECVPTPFGIDNSSCSSAITISACGGVNGQYRWYTTASGGTPIAGETNASLSLANILTTTTYYVALNDGVCEGVRIPVVATITSSGISAPTTTGSSTCASGSLVLTATGGANGQYRWYTIATGGTALTGEVNSSYTTPVISATTTYYVSINDGTCESSRTPVIATINSTLIAPTATGGSSCGTGVVTLTASGGTNGQYRWYAAATGGTTITGEVNSSYTTPSLSSTTTYYVSVNVGSCESTRTAVVALLNTPPTAPTTIGASSCIAASLTLNASGGVNGQYRWYILATGGTALTREVNSLYTTPSISATTTYYVSINDGACESSRTPVVATINSTLPAPTATGGSSCGTGVVTLTASGGTNGQYRWYTVATGGTALTGQVNSSFTSPSISTTTTYYVSINDGTCESTRTSVIATINTPPSTPTATGGSSCGTGLVTLNASGGTTGQYRWYTVATGGTALAGEVNSSFTTPSISTTTTYYVSINDGTCESSRTSVVATINTPPSAPTATGGSSCGTGVVTLNASGGVNGQYRWYTLASGGTALTGQVNSSYTSPSISTTTTYYVSINNGSCESLRSSVLATINPVPAKPIVTTSGSTTLCSGQSVTLSAPVGFTYSWSTGAASQQIIVSSSGSFTVQITSAGCTSVASDPIVVSVGVCNQPPVIAATTVQAEVEGSVTLKLTSLLSDPDNNLDLSTLRIIQQPSSGASASINPNNELILNYQGLSFAGIDELIIEVCDLSGDCVQQKITIDVVGDIIVYNAISPNDDNKNPAFILKYIDAIEQTKNNKVSIFNRWGDLVWEGVNYNNTSVAFTGANKNGNELPTGTYFYKIEFVSGRKTDSGYLSLKR